MPDPPSVNPVMRYLLENPYPLAVVLLAVGAGIFWSGMRDGVRRRLLIGGILVMVAAGVLGVASLIVTSGEHARRVTLEMVDAIVTGDIVGATNTVAADGALTIASTTNAGFDKSFFNAQLSWLNQRYSVATNRVTRQDAYSVSSDEGLVYLACITEVESGFAPAVTQWVVRVRRQPDDTWKIHRLTWISINNQPAKRNYLK